MAQASPLLQFTAHGFHARLQSTHCRPRGRVTAALGDPFVVELAEKLEESCSLNNTNTTLRKLRERCAEEALGRQWPSGKDEAFRFTDVRFLRDCKIEVPQPLDMAVHLDRDWSVDEAYKLVIIDGQLSPSLSNTTGLPDGVFVGSVSALPDTFAFPSLASMEGDLFSFLNGIGTPDLGVIIVPDGCKLDRPLHLLYYSQQGGDDAQSVCVSSPRLVVLLGKGAEMDIIEEFGGSASKSYWTNSVLDVSIGEHAKLCHTFIQAQPQHAIHVKWTFVQQGTSSSYKLVETSTGGRLSRHNLQIQQLGPDTVTELSTFHLAGGRQTQDLHSKIILNYPRGYSRQLHKCIVTHSSGHAVFDGNIKVNRYAQLTDAGQLSRSLLLAPRATVNVKPNLQIVADDVKCSHGAAVSDLEDDQIFYFQARGVDVQTARNALVFSFGAEVIERLPYKDLRKRVECDVKGLLAAEGAFH
eukprot:Gb_08273 [translate_table: standard]